ncbi:uncharacterized protein F4822DRAFT_435442 [Hypoxylon trugodes]|uniref:uncharacterized protein n=1 Tax=Hypoxylon trugodes TaxID=326681 RepID=UPI0021993E23|nr:uncharacterized protein F4822DRAFT_435442 [Hypoxylon trugodes]KAI1382574.1 hypothetical protein F4822DRAFT_435442 [Hypoxylon trugodes]
MHLASNINPYFHTKFLPAIPAPNIVPPLPLSQRRMLQIVETPVEKAQRETICWLQSQCNSLGEENMNLRQQILELRTKGTETTEIITRLSQEIEQRKRKVRHIAEYVTGAFREYIDDPRSWSAREHMSVYNVIDDILSMYMYTEL